MKKARREKMQVREKVGKSRNNVFFQCFAASEGRKVGSLKQRVRSQLARLEIKSCTPLWREARFEVKSGKARRVQTTFGSRDIEKVHPVVARSIYGSKNVRNTSVSDHFWKLRCRKSAGEAHVEVKMYKTPHVRATYGRPDPEHRILIPINILFSRLIWV